MKNLLLVLSIFICVVSLKAQPPTAITKLDYISFNPNEIPELDGSLVEEWANQGGGSLHDIIIDNLNSFCNQEFEDMNLCFDGNGSRWSAWQLGAYNVKDAQYGCKIRVEYLFRFCEIDHNLTQHKILAVFFEVSDNPSISSLCDQLLNWIYEGNSFPDQDKLHYLFEDMYLKIGTQSFKDNNALVNQTQGHDIFCGEDDNYPTKVYHVTGSCKAYCYGTFRDSQGKLQTVITEKNCYPDKCCTILNKFCIDPETGKIKIDPTVILGDAGIAIECQYMQPPPINCYGETNYITDCSYKCGDEYLIKDYQGPIWIEYPFKDIYADEIDPLFYGSSYVPPKISTDMIGNQSGNKMMNIFPNPTNNSINLVLNSEICKSCAFAIYNSKGLLISNHFKTSETNTIVDVSNYPNGTYYVLVSSNYKKYIKPFIIAK